MSEETQTQEQQPLEKVTNLDQAVGVLMAAANEGKNRGIYGWNDLALIGQSIELIETLTAQAKAQQEAAKAQQEALENTKSSDEGQQNDVTNLEVVEPEPEKG